MDREAVKNTLLEYGWDAAERQKIAEILHAAATDPECREAAAAYDQIRAALRPSDIAEPPDGWQAFDDRMRAALVNRRPRLWYRMSGLAAAVLVLAVVGSQLIPKLSTIRGSGAAQAGIPLAFGQQEIQNRIAAFHEVAGLFEQRTQWLLVSDATADLGLGPAAMPADDPLLLLRLAISRGTECVSRCDVVIVAGQSATLTVPFDDGRQLRYEISTTDGSPTRLTLWAKVLQTDTEERTLAAVATDLWLEPGAVSGAGEMVTSSGAYSLKIAFARAGLGEE